MKPAGKADKVFGRVPSTNKMSDAADSQIRQWRVALNLSQRELARLADIPVSTLNDIENGYRDGVSVREHLLAALCKVAGRMAPVAIEILSKAGKIA